MGPVLRLSALSGAFFHAFGSTTKTHKPLVPSTLAEFIECDSRLAAALHEARIHQGRQREIDKLMLEVVALDAQLREAIIALTEGKDVLESIISDGIAILDRADLASKGGLNCIQNTVSSLLMLANVAGAVSHRTILSYASNLAKFTSAPPTVEPLRPESIFEGNIIPPFPTVEMMRRGKMNNEIPLGSLGESREVGRSECPRGHKRTFMITLKVLTVASPSFVPHIAFSPSLVQSQTEAQKHLVHGGPTQYSTYAAAHSVAVTDLDDLFDLDLNPDF